MKSYRYLSALLALPFLAQAAVPQVMNLKLIGPIRASAAKPPAPEVKLGEVLLKYKSGVTSTARSQSLNSAQAVHLATVGSAQLEHVKIRAGLSVDEAIAEFKADPNVESVQPNFIYHINAVPNDPQYPQQWAANNTGQTITGADYTTNDPGTSGSDMGLQKAWDVRTDCSSTIVAIVDTGVNYKHEDLATNMWDGGANYPLHGYNFFDNTNDPMDANGHGSHVAGIIGAVGNNATGISGVCWKANIMAVRVFGPTGSATSAAIVAGLDFAAKNGAKVVNMSFGGDNDDPAEKAEMQTLASQNIVLVIAAGNAAQDNDTTPTYPCAYDLPNMICVAALDQAGQLASFSNYGSSTVHIGAPGTNILSSYLGAVTTQQVSVQTNNTLNWTTSGGAWAYGSRTFTLSDGSKQAFDMILNPSNWDGQTKTYANNLDARAFKSIDLSGYDKVTVDIEGFYDIGAGDNFNIAFNKSGTDPFGTGGVALDDITGSTNGSSFLNSYDLTPCIGTTCALGLQLLTDANTVDFGVGILAVQLDLMKINTTTYKILDGTSMATPQVAGLATMIFSQNPSYTAADVINSIKAGGTSLTSLASKTTTGKAANAFGAISYINAPTGVQASVAN